MPFRTKNNVLECSSRLNKLKDASSVADGACVCVQSINGNSFNLAVVNTRFGNRIPLMRYYGQLSDDLETGGAKICGRFESAITIKIMLYAIPIVFGLIAYILGWRHTLPFLDGKQNIIILASFCTGMLLSTPILTLARRTKERIYCFIEEQLEAEYLDEAV